MSVYDAFVDAGKAATSPEDQIATIRIIREVRGQQFSIREGSVVPDLSKPRFRPRNPPPVPPFSDTIQSLGKRSRDDAFRGEPSHREESQGTSSTRRRRLHNLTETGETDRPVPSIERDSHQNTKRPNHHQIRQESPVIIPETQESPPKRRSHSLQNRQDGSEILGDEEPKSESPEVEDSIHSFPLAHRDDDDLEIVEAAPPARNGLIGSNVLHHGQIQSQAAPTEEPASRSPSNYYSPPSGSLQSRSNGRIPGDELAVSSADIRGQFCPPDPKTRLTRTKSNHAKERLISNGPITPITYASRDLQSKLTSKEAGHRASNGVGPPSRTSSFSYKFRREDRLESVESEIDDTQMSPRSRRSLKRPRDARNSDTGIRFESDKLAGLSHQRDERRNLVQQGKRQRNETNRDSREYVQGLSETEHEFHSREDDQGQDEQDRLSGSNLSESEDVEDMTAQIAKSQRRSNATNKGSNASNASTERPTTYTSLNALRRSQTPQPQAVSEGKNTNALAENDSDKENAAQEQEMCHQAAGLNQHQDVNIAAQERSSEAAEIEKAIEDAVVKKPNQVSDASDAPTKPSLRNSQAQPIGIVEQLQSSSNQPSDITPKRSRRKKKSQLEGDRTSEPESQQMNSRFDDKMTGNAFAAANRETVSSTNQLQPGGITVALNKADDQLSQDLQASAQAGDKKPTLVGKLGKGSSRKQSSSLRALAGESFSKSQQEQADSEREASIVDRKKVKSKDMSRKWGSSDSNADVALTNHLPVGSVYQENGEDGRIGLGFSQSPPSKNRAFRPSSVKRDNFHDKSRNETSEDLPSEQDKVSFLTKPKSSDKVMSSQSWSAETPSRSTQQGEKVDHEREQTDMNGPRGKSETHGLQVEVIGGVPGLTNPSSNSADSSSVSDDEASSIEDERTLKITEASATDGSDGSSEDAAVGSIENASDSSIPESSTALRPSKTAKKADRPSKIKASVIPKENKSYPVQEESLSVVIPPGLSLETYNAMKSDFEKTKLAKANAPNRSANSPKLAPTRTSNRKGKTATAVPVSVEVAPKKSLPTSKKQQEGNAKKAKKAKETRPLSPAPPQAETSVKSAVKVSKTTAPPRPSTKASQTTQAPAAPKMQHAIEASSSVKPASTSSKSIAGPSAKPNGPSHHPTPPTNLIHSRAITAQTPSTLHELKAKLKAERADKRAAASSSKLPSVTNANKRSVLQGQDESDDDDDDDDESESETETEIKPSDQRIVATMQGRGVAAKTKTPALMVPQPTTTMTATATGTGTVDLSIRDPSPSSDEEEDEEEE
jgi:hypothetical protein